MDRRRAAGALLVLAACVAYATAAPTASNHTSLDLYDGTPDGCYYNFQHYREGDRIMTNEPCLNCTCHNRMLMCYLRVCPFTKAIGQDCTIEKRADQCCPIVTCPDVPVDLLTSTTTSPAEYGATGLGHADKFGCSINGKYFSEGSKVPPTPNKPCEHCYCIRNMTTCVMQECTLHVDGCTPIYHKDVCCPVRYSCDHPEDEMPLLDDLSTTVRPTPGFLLTTTTLAPVTQMTQDCLYENKIIPDGALIKTEKACDHCYCMKGDIVCVVQECGTPMENEGKNCTAIAPREGVCCPDTYICEGDEPTTETYDGQSYTTTSEILTTKVPPRRVESEGSGYRNEPDDILKTEPPTIVSELEGSGDEDSVTEALPVSQELPLATDTVTKTPAIFEDLTTKGGEQTDVSEIVPSTTSSSIIQRDELLTTKGQDEEIGSGEEDITTDKIVPITSDVLAIEDESTSKPSLMTTKPSEDESSGDQTTKAPIVHEDETIPRVTKDDEITKSTLEIENAPTTEQTSVKTTSSIPTGDDTISLTTGLQDDKEDRPKITQEPEFSSTTSAPGIEDDIVTTESQGLTEDHEVPGVELEPHHEITMTASTPLLEEIEKDTIEQQKEVDEDITDIYKTSTTLANVPTITVADHDNKPDLLDETIVTNIPTTITPLEIDESDITTAEPQTEEDTETASDLAGETKKTTPSDYFTLEPQTTQHTLKESSEPEQSVPITTASISTGDSQIATLSSSITTSEPPKSEDEISELPKTTKSPTTSADIEVKKTTPIESQTLETETENEANIGETPEPQPPSTTSNLLIDDEERVTSPATTPSSSESEFGHDVTEKITESQKYTPTTTAFTSQEESNKSTQPAIETQTSEDTDLGDREVAEESSEPQQYSPTTTSSLIEEESKKTTMKDVSGDTVYQQNEFTTIEPDKGLNTIPSGSIEEETTEAAEKYTQSNEPITTVSGAELQNKLDGVTEASIAPSKQTTDLDIPQEATDKEIIGDMAHDIVEQTSLPAVVSEETITSTESPLIEETSTASVPSATETGEQTSDSKEPKETKTYESSTQALQTENPITDKHETSSPSYPIIPESTTANLEENEIFNEPRIPGEGDCLFNGVTYRNESAVPSTNKCQSDCRCISSIIKCDPIICSAPPEYMDNCQTVYDSLDSCCPTYVCDHKTETIPPQSHSQMSGTEAPVSPVKCNGDECVLSGDKKQPEEIPSLCNSDDCSSQVVTIPQPNIIPEQPIEHHVECTGDKCVPSGPSNQLCDDDSGCQASPVKPCEGSECEITSPTTIAPQKLEPCIDGICDAEINIPETKPDDSDIEKECTEKSCKRKGDSEPDQQVPEKCSGLECQSHESKPAMEQTSVASITLAPKDSEQEEQTTLTDLASVTEKGETSDTDSATKPTTDTTDKTIDDSSQTKTSMIAEDITTQLPNLHERPEETSTLQESATSSKNDDSATKSTLLPDAETEKPLDLPEEQKPEKQDDVTTETGDIVSSIITTTPPRETENYTTLVETQNKPTEIPEKDVSEDRATSVSEDIITEQPKPQDVSSESPDIKPTDVEPPVTISTPVTDRETSEHSTIQPSIVSTTPLEETYDSELQKTNQPSVYTQYEETTASDVSKTEEITKPPQESDVTKKVIEEIDSTVDSHDVTKSPQSTYSAETTTSEAAHLGPESPELGNEYQYITTASEDTRSEVTTPKLSDDSGIEKVTEISDKNDVDDTTPNLLEKLTTKSPLLIDIGPETDAALDVTTHSESDVKQTTTSSVEQDVETTTKTRTELPELTEPSKAIEIDTTQPQAITEPSNVIDSDEDKTTKTPEMIISETTTVQQEAGMEETSIRISEQTGTESFESTHPPQVPDNELITTISEGTSKSDDLESQGVTQPTVPESVPPHETTLTIESTEDGYKTTYVPYSQENSSIILESISDNITPSILPDSQSSEPAVTSFNEITTIAYDRSEPTEHATQSSTKYIEETTLSSSIAPIFEEENIITISEKEITETPLNLVTESEQSPEKPAPETEQDKIDKTASIPPKEYDNKTPIYESEATATESIGDLDKTTQKPEPTRIIDLGEDKTETPLIQESEKDMVPEIATKPNDATTTSYPKESSDETLEITTKPVSQDMTTELLINEMETKIPDVFTDIQTDKPVIREDEPTEPEKDKFDTEAPYVNELSTSMPVDFSTEKATKETETPQATDSTEHAQPDEEIPSTRIPANGQSEAVTTEVVYTMDAKLTTLASEHTTELSKLQTPTEFSVTSDDDSKLTTLAAEQITDLSKVQTPTELNVSSHETEIPSTVLDNEPSESPTFNPIDVETTSPTAISESKEPETVTEISGIPDLTTQVSDKDTNTEYSDDKIATEDPNALDKDKVQEIATESDNQIPHEPLQPITETLDTDERGTTIAPSQDSEEILLVTKATKTPEPIQTSTSFSEMTTMKYDEDIEKSPDHVTTSKYSETSTNIIVVEEKTTPVTEIPLVISDQHTVNLATETQLASTETATEPQKSATELVNDLVTGKPTLLETTSYSTEVTEKPTLSPLPVEIITEADQSLTSIEPHVEQSGNTVISEIDRTSTPVVPEIEVEKEIVTPSSEKPLLVPSTEISAQDEIVTTTAKAEDITTPPVFDKFTTPAYKPTELAATEQPKPIPTEQPTDEIISPDDEPSMPSGGSSGYGTDPDYMEEDQTFGPGTCRYGGKVYVSAQQIPRDDPCDFCFCFRSDIICLQQSCPPPIHGCHEEPISGFCCPRYECPVSMATTVNVTTTTTTTTTTLPPHFPVHSYKGSAQKRGCLIKGHTYKVGEVVRASSGPCLHCTCGGDGQMKCDPKQCTPEPMLRQMIAAAVSAKRRR